MSNKIERTVKLDPDAADLLLQLAGSPRKQGEWLSAMIREKAREQNIFAARLQALEAELHALRAQLRPLDESPQEDPAHER